MKIFSSSLEKEKVSVKKFNLYDNNESKIKKSDEHLTEDWIFFFK